MFSDFLPGQTMEQQALLTEISKRTKNITFLKNQFILKQLCICSNLYELQSGLVRSFYMKNGKEITSWFSAEGTMVTSAYSFISRKPSIENIVAVEDCVMTFITRKDLYELYDLFPVMNEIGRKIIEIYFLELEDRINALHFQTARERYASLVKNESYLLQRVPLGHIASYLGITQETLSRIRAQK